MQVNSDEQNWALVFQEKWLFMQWEVNTGEKGRTGRQNNI